MINIRQRLHSIEHEQILKKTKKKHADSERQEFIQLNYANLDIFPLTKSVQMQETTWSHRGRHVFVSIKAERMFNRRQNEQ